MPSGNVPRLRRTDPSEVSLLIYAPAVKVGGPLRYLREAVGLVCAQWPGDVTLAIPEERLIDLPALPPRVRVEGVPRPTRGHLSKVLHTQMHALRLGRELNPDVIFCLGNIAYFGPRRKCATMIQNAARLRDLRHPGLATLRYIVGLRVLLMLTTLRSQLLLPVSKHTASVVPFHSIRPMVVAPHGIDDRARSPNGSGRSLDFGSIVIPGSVQPYRGYELVLRALVDAEEHVRVSIVGEVGDRRYLRYCQGLARSLGVEHRISWVGPLPFEELWSFMRSCRAVLLSSRVEAFPNVMLEAAACNPQRPLLALRFPWSVEFEDLFDGRYKPGDLTAALNWVGPASSDPVIVARRQGIERYHWEHSTSIAVTALQDLGHGHPPRRRGRNG